MAGDLEQLLEMGFDKSYAELAVKKTGNLSQAIDWLEQNASKPLEELQAAAAADEEDEEQTKINVAPSEQLAKSLVCKECGKKFRTHDAASYHAGKTEHTDFEESTEELAPLTEAEKQARLEELREKARLKKETQSQQEKEEAKRNEQIRLKANKDTQQIKEELARKEQIKEAAKKRQEKADDIEAKRRIKAKIEADKAERKRKEEEAKALREGRAPAAPAAPVASTPLSASSGSSSSAANARLRIQTKSGNIIKTYPSSTTLAEVAHAISEETGQTVQNFQTTFPKKTYDGADFGQTLAEAGLAPSAVIIANFA
ncbi:ubiquitin-related domain-containing protein [Podospora fimiseda]|uniref:Ubiquitin-related domain-containing protein n=1 Tax=Podospora fimiseda TaxID=252190 RepID=A0AAN7GZT6_9PEZI|nr:ubiquitin-related domain-containing protein [Podospora fimiseda]